jgi:hypothetical protein
MGRQRQRHRNSGQVEIWRNVHGLRPTGRAPPLCLPWQAGAGWWTGGALASQFSPGSMVSSVGEGRQKGGGVSS